MNVNEIHMKINPVLTGGFNHTRHKLAELLLRDNSTSFNVKTEEVHTGENTKKEASGSLEVRM